MDSITLSSFHFNALLYSLRVPGMVLGTGGTAVSSADTGPAFGERKVQ